MAFEDLFGGNEDLVYPDNFKRINTVDPRDFIGNDPVANQLSGVTNDTVNGGSGFSFSDLFNDPNFIRGLGETGAAISSGESIGKSVGDFASNLTRRRAVQKGARDSRGEQKSFQERLLSMLSQGNLLSAKDQNDAFDTLSIDGDGNVNLGMKNTPQKQGFQRNQPLESIKRLDNRGTDLPNFSNQPGGIDFAGLDAEDISMLLKAEQQFGQLNQNQMRMVLDEKNKRKAAIIASKNRAEDLKQLALDRTEKIRQFNVTQQNVLDEKDKDRSFRQIELNQMQDNQIALINERDRLSKIPSTMQTTDQAARLRALDSEINVENKRIEKMDAEIRVLDKGKTVTPTQQATIEKQNADLARKETELGLKLDKLEKDEFFSMQPSFIDKKGNTVDVPFEEREANASQANNRPNNKVFYYVQPPVEDLPAVYKWGPDQPGNVIPIFLPKNKKTGKQVTSAEIINYAESKGVSPEEILKQQGLIK